MIQQLILFCLVTLTLAACATPKFRAMDTTKPIEYSDSWRDSFLKQDGESIVPTVAYENFAADPATRDAVSGYKPWLYSGFVLAGVGGYMIGYDAFSKDKKNLWIAGAGLVALSFWPMTIAENKLKSAAQIYNQRFTKKRGSKLNAFVTPIDSGVAGSLQITFD